MALIDDLIIGVSARSNMAAGLNKGRRELQGFVAGAKKIGDQLQTAIFGGLSLYAAGGFVRSSVQAFAESEQAAARLGAVLESTGYAAGVTADQVRNLASQLQTVTRFEDDTTTAAASMLATFTNIKGNVFSEAIIAAQDMSTILESDLKSSIIQIGKALNDPIRGITALSRSGVSFNAEQKALIGTLAESGRVLEAQQMILAELNKEFGGAAQADAQTYAGKIDQLNNAWGDVKKTLGESLTPALLDVASVLKEIVATANGMEPAFAGASQRIAAMTPSVDMSPEQLRKMRDELDSIEKNAVASQARRQKEIESMGVVGHAARLPYELGRRASAFLTGQSMLDPVIADAHAAAEQARELRGLITRMLGGNTAAPIVAPVQLEPPKYAPGVKGAAFADMLSRGMEAGEGLFGSILSGLDDVREGFADTIAAGQRFVEQLERGQQIFMDTRTPIEQYAMGLDELQRLLAVGAINQDTFNRAKLGLRGELMDSIPNSGGGTSAVLRGSRGAAQAIEEFRGRSARDQQAERMAKAVDEQLKVQEQSRDFLRDAKDLLEKVLPITVTDLLK